MAAPIAFLLPVGLVSSLLAGGPVGRVSQVSWTPATCHFFASNHYTSTEFLALSKDGQYAILDAEHMFVDLSDQGHWKQRTDGVVELTSRTRCRDLETDTFRVNLPPTKQGDQGQEIVPIAVAVQDFLARNPCPSFSADEIRGISSYHLAFAPDDEFEAISVLDGRDENRPIPRSALESLLNSMQEFVLASDSNVFRFRVLRFEDTTYLEWQNSGYPEERDRAEVIETIRAKKEVPPGMIYVEISCEEFAAMAGKTQQFVFYPELNSNRGSDKEQWVTSLSRACGCVP